MAVKILIHRKIKPGKEKELSEAVRALRFKAMYAQGYISGELEEPTKITSYQYESISPGVDEILTGVEFSVQDE